MPIVSILTQPGAGAIKAAQAPIVFQVRAQRTDLNPVPPVVFCDIYINGVFYRTIAKTQYINLNSTNTDWEFNITDPVQDYLASTLPDFAGVNVVENAGASCRVFCRFRSSGVSDGFVTPEGTAPVQATSNTAAAPGTGLQSSEFYAVNAVLQTLDTGLQSVYDAFKNGTWSINSFPLTKRLNSYKLCRLDHDLFGFYDAVKSCYKTIRVNYRRFGQNSYHQATYLLPTLTCAAVVSNVQTLQTGTDVNVSWDSTGTPEGFKYRVDGGLWLTTTNKAILLSGLSVGSHTIIIVPFCNCNEGTSATKTFSVVSSAALCIADIASVTFNQTGAGAGNMVVSATGSAVSFNYRIDGGAWVNTTSSTIPLTGLSAGNHTFEVIAICSNGSTGGNALITFNVTSAAQYIVIAFNSANGNHQIQRSFDDGKTAIHYRIFCAVSNTWQGPFTASLGPGALTSAVITGSGPHCNTALTDVTFTP